MWSESSVLLAQQHATSQFILIIIVISVGFGCNKTEFRCKNVW